MPARTAQLPLAAGLATFLISLTLPISTETAEANGDTRTISLYHAHTGESIEATFRINGHYDPSVLHKLNWFLRDFRRDEQTNMDPRLFDVVWETYRAAGAHQPIVVYSAYRSPETNAMLRARSRAVAKFSQHMLGKAMDTTMPGMSMERIREIGMRMQRGGVGYYSSSNFVHLDVGHVRSWPRMSYDQLARLFPDGKTVHLAADGRTMPRFEEARAEIEANGGTPVYMAESKPKNFFAWLFGAKDEEDEGEVQPPPRYTRPKPQRTQVASRGELEDLPVPSNGNRAPFTSAPLAASHATAPAPAPLAATRQAPETPHTPEPTRAAVAVLPPARPVLDRELMTASIAPELENTAGKAEKSIETALMLPPRRPSDLAADIENTAAAAPAPAVPVPPSRPMALAALTPAEAAGESLLRPLPTKPIVPAETEAVAQPQPPVPPVRPAQEPPAAPVQTAAALPSLITQGKKEDKPSANATAASGYTTAPVPNASQTILAYAPMQGLRTAATMKTAAVKSALAPAADRPAKGSRAETASRSLSSILAPVQKAEMAPARLDPSNFWVMTGTTEMKNAGPAMFGASANGLRTAAKASAPILSKTLTAGVTTAFKSSSEEPATNRFMTADNVAQRAPNNAVRVIDRTAPRVSGNPLR
ncbi:DUF882 domain-containing protein [Beijerinckia mobilis]|uniref:DUF882 domain-containing protein n=1 Tax=Beijerinckia mobilis TaxID=231434 RepID=UPI000AB0E4D7|nr:DUF882 domain-containing protein [Beijerinckia mobilis]